MIGPSRERVYGLARMSTQPAIEAFKAKWLGSQSAERSNSQLFLTELTRPVRAAVGIERDGIA